MKAIELLGVLIRFSSENKNLVTKIYSGRALIESNFPHRHFIASKIISDPGTTRLDHVLGRRRRPTNRVIRDEKAETRSRLAQKCAVKNCEKPFLKLCFFYYV